MRDNISNYGLHGFSLHAIAETSELLDCADSLLKGFRIADDGQAKAFLKLSYESADCSSSPSAEMHLAWDGMLPGGVSIKYWVGPRGRWCELAGIAKMSVDFDRREAAVFAKTGAEWGVRSWCIPIALIEFLGEAGHYVVHAAGLAAEAGGTLKGIMVAGPSGHGKTTTALSLARAGMRLLSDDTSFLMESDEPDGRVMLWGLPTRCKVSRRTMEILPWLLAAPRVADPSIKEFPIDAYPLLGSHFTGFVAPAAVFLLDQYNAVEHRITPVSKAEAVGVLTSQNVRAVEQHTAGRAGRTFRAIARLVQQSQTYLLSVGPRPETLYERVLDLLQ